MKHPDFRRNIIPSEYFESNLEFANEVVACYESEKDKALSCFQPRVPFVITMPKLTDNAFAAKKVIRKQDKGINPECTFSEV